MCMYSSSLCLYDLRVSSFSLSLSLCASSSSTAAEHAATTWGEHGRKELSGFTWLSASPVWSCC